MIVPGMFVCSSFLISVCMFILSKALLISSATVIVRAGGAIWLNPFATVLFSAVTVECCVLYPYCMGVLVCLLFALFKRLRHILSDSVDLEVTHCHSNPETRQGLLSQHFLSTYLAPLYRSEIYGGSLTSNRQQPPAFIRRPTRFPTRTVYHFCFATTDE